MDNATMTRILLENYSLGELEERLDLTPEDLEDGVYNYVASNQHKVDQMLREDLFL